MTILIPEAAAAAEGAGATAGAGTGAGASSSSSAAGEGAGGAAAKPKASSPDSWGSGKPGKGKAKGAAKGKLDEVIEKPQKKAKPEAKPQPENAPDKEGQGDEDEGEESRGGLRDAIGYRRPQPVETGAGLLLGFFVWGLTVNWIRGGRTQAVNWLKAKFLNQVGASSVTPIPLAKNPPKPKPGGISV